jgi:hypothetical protein
MKAVFSSLVAVIALAVGVTAQDPNTLQINTP